MRNKLPDQAEQEKAYLPAELNVFFNRHLEEIYKRYRAVADLYEKRDRNAKFGHKSSHFFLKLYPKPTINNLLFRASIDFIFRHFGPNTRNPEVVQSEEELQERLNSETTFTVVPASELKIPVAEPAEADKIPLLEPESPEPAETEKAPEINAEPTPVDQGIATVKQAVPTVLKDLKKAAPRDDDDGDASAFIIEHATEPAPRKKIKP